MLNPSVDQMLSGMADALARTVLPELAPGPARDELQAAIALTRRLARAVPHLYPYLHSDIADLAGSLSELWAAVGQEAPSEGPVAEALARALAQSAEPPAGASELIDIDLTLRQAVADLVTAHALTDEPSGAADEMLRALLSRLAQREAEQLRLSPWAPLTSSPR